MALKVLTPLTIHEEFALKVLQTNRKDKIMNFAPIIVLTVLVLLFSVVLGSSFLSAANFTAILNQLAIPLLVALGLTFVILLGSIDLSIDGTIAMSASFLGVLVLNSSTDFDMGFFAVIFAVGSSVLVGLLVGTIHVHLRIPSFMVSFAFMHITRGLGLMSYRGQRPMILDEAFRAIPTTFFMGIPFITWVALGVLLVCIFIQEFTAFGRYIYAVGTDETVLKAVGVSVNAVKIKVFALAGFCFGVAGVLAAIRNPLGGGVGVVGTGLMFPAQAAVVAGGTALAGGKGGVRHTIVGVLIITILENGLLIMGVNPFIRTGIQGLIILAAVALTVVRSAKAISK